MQDSFTVNICKGYIKGWNDKRTYLSVEESVYLYPFYLEFCKGIVYSISIHYWTVRFCTYTVFKWAFAPRWSEVTGA